MGNKLEQVKRVEKPSLQQLFTDQVSEKLQAEFSYKSKMQVPRILKVVVNMGLGRANQSPKVIASAADELRAITGQSPVICLAKKDIAGFKLRQGQKIGVMVTLRRDRMWEFLGRVIQVALPRVRDFRGVSDKAFDGRGNYTLGLREQIIFPEIQYDKIDSVKGLNITIVTTANTDAEARSLLRHLGMPFRQHSTAAKVAKAS